MNELDVNEINLVSGGRMPLWAAIWIEGACTAAGAFIGIAGGPVGVGIGATAGSMAGAAIVHASGD